VRSTAECSQRSSVLRVVVRTLDGEPDKPLAIVTTPAPVDAVPAVCTSFASDALGRMPGPGCDGAETAGARGLRRHLLTSFPFGI
jgi:hypothetical protein